MSLNGLPKGPSTFGRTPLFERAFGTKPTTDAIRILSIDGGGIRGIIPAVFLAELEKRTGTAISQLFDHIAGTSTGSVIALGLSVPSANDPTRPRFSAQEVVDHYVDLGKSVFSTRGLRELIHRANPATPKYHNEFLHHHLQTAFGDTHLSETLVNLTIPALAICSREAFIFSAADAKASANHDFKVWEVARASSAAPTFFEPFAMTDRAGNRERVLVDGGLVANNPAMCAFTEAERDGETHDVVLTSIGTGEMQREFEWPAVKDWGVAQWARPMLSLLMDGSSQSIDYQLRHILGPDRYTRFQVPVTRGSEHLDDASSENIQHLLELGNQMIRVGDRKIDELCATLTSR